ncbi:MAG: ComEC/Rec2 family competence protein [Puniceicoccales bacterium]|jgi:ComEC/Rec2-related protein|nr:ComEC/Rec2 family competence protein [Puniceicoccales bacterium]
MLRYPIMWANISLIFGLCFVNAIFSKDVVSFVRTSLFLICFFMLYRIRFKKSCLVVGGITIATLYGCFFVQRSGQHTKKHTINGIFYFEKIFRTPSDRVGGIGNVYLKDHTHCNDIYIHIKNRSGLKVAEDKLYRLHGTLYPLKFPFKASQSFSYYLWARGIRYHLAYAQLKNVGNNLSPSLIQRLRWYFRKSLQAHFKDANKSNTYQAILLGKKELLSEKNLNHFFDTGTMHLFAVSGLHVGVVSTFLFFFFKSLFLPKIFRLFFTLAGVFLYSSIVGFSPSTLRASCMVLFVIIMQLCSRPVDGRAAFLNTAFFALAVNPWQIWDVGFQLSYGVVASILGLGTPSSRRLSTQRNRFVRSFVASLCISVSASLISSVLTIYYWGMLTPWAFLVNLFLIPIASFVVILGTISFITNLIFPSCLCIVNYLSENVISLLLFCVDVCARLPGSVLKVSCNANIFYTCLFLFFLYVLKIHEGNSKLLTRSPTNTHL